MSNKDYLTEDTLFPEGQRYICMSFLTDPDKKTTLSGIKLRGCFSTIDEASEHAKKIQSADQYHNVFVGEMGKWLAFDPDPTSEAAGNPEYANDQLNDIMQSYCENQEKAKLFHEYRKNEEVSKTIRSNIETSNSNKKELEEKLQEAKSEEVDNIKEKLNRTNKKIEEFEKKLKDNTKANKKLAKKLDIDNDVSKDSNNLEI